MERPVFRPADVMMRRLTPFALILLLAGCGRGPVQPVDFDAAHEACRFCRMTGSDGRTAAQLVSPGEEPLFFDDIGCLRDYVRQTSLAASAVMFVADHRTRAWVRADSAIFTQQAQLATPMSSHLIAHASAVSRDADADAREGAVVTIEEIFAGVRLGGLH
jgi:copper chaperone NosL